MLDSRAMSEVFGVVLTRAQVHPRLRRQMADPETAILPLLARYIRARLAVHEGAVCAVHDEEEGG